jgi:hypothetical protein
LKVTTPGAITARRMTDGGPILAIGLPFGVWAIGPAVSALFVVVAIAGGSRGDRRLGPSLVAAGVAGGWNLLAWAILRHAMAGHAGAFESAFIQLAMGSVATFLFAVAWMIARRLMSRRG